MGESKIFALASELLKESPFTVERTTLDVGDYRILDDNGTPCVVVERKTHADMAGSLQSKNHMKEQVYRLRAFRVQFPAAVVFIVYEGPMSMQWYEKKIGSMPNRNIDMFLTCVTCRDGVAIHHTVSEEHTANWLIAMMRKEHKGELRSKGGEGDTPRETDYLKTLALSKTGNCTTKNQYVRMLMAIDGVSAERATCVAGAYATCTTLVRALETDASATEEALANLPVKKRRLGPSVAKAIVSAFTQ